MTIVIDSCIEIVRKFDIISIDSPVITGRFVSCYNVHSSIVCCSCVANTKFGGSFPYNLTKSVNKMRSWASRNTGCCPQNWYKCKRWTTWLFLIVIPAWSGRFVCPDCLVLLERCPYRSRNYNHVFHCTLVKTHWRWSFGKLWRERILKVNIRNVIFTTRPWRSILCLLLTRDSLQHHKDYSQASQHNASRRCELLVPLHRTVLERLIWWF